MIALNNYLNIRYNSHNKWRGQIGSRRGFCMFSDSRFCVRAFSIIVFRSYVRAGVRSYSDIINRYAPPSENNTSHYIDYVCRFCGVLPSQIPATATQKCRLVMAMWRFESGLPCPYTEVELTSILKSARAL